MPRFEAEKQGFYFRQVCYIRGKPLWKCFRSGISTILSRPPLTDEPSQIPTEKSREKSELWKALLAMFLSFQKQRDWYKKENLGESTSEAI